MTHSSLETVGVIITFPLTCAEAQRSLADFCCMLQVRPADISSKSYVDVYNAVCEEEAKQLRS